MRRKFFLTIFCVLCLTAVSVSAIHYHFFRSERLRLIELNLEQNAAILARSELPPESEIVSGENDLADELIGDDKINVIVAIYDQSGQILYRNDNAEIFSTPDQLADGFAEWEDVETRDYFIKYLTVRDEARNRIIRVGMVLNQSLLRWRDLNQRIYLFATIIISVITLISFFLTQLLFRPVQRLAAQVNLMGDRLETGEFQELRAWFQRLETSGPGGGDEFQALVRSLRKLADKITETQAKTQKWTALMAHELKTPMTLLRISIEQLARSAAPPERIEAVELDLRRLEDIVMNFLEWASAENDTSSPELHAIQLVEKCTTMAAQFQRSFPGLEVSLTQDPGSELRIFCHPIHFEQLLGNLFTNAQKYGGGKVELTLRDGELVFRDRGPGIPAQVLENFGQPFNRFARNTEGQGLGLAWVSTIARKYGWRISISNDSGAVFRISFPASEA